MRSMWNGSLSFGLVNIPVKMYTATQGKDIRFNQLHRLCNTPIKYEKICPNCQRKVEAEEIVRGYQYERGHYVIIQDEEWEEFSQSASNTVDILRFVELREVDPIYYDKTYYLEPSDTGGKAYSLLREALSISGKIAVAKMTIRSKPTLAIVRIYQGLLAIETIFYPDEVREHSKLLKTDLAVDERELNMALTLIESLTEPFRPDDYQDERRLGLQELIDAKISGQEVVLAERKDDDAPALDLMAALQASIQAQESKHGSHANGVRH